jgi:beta-lactamase regulating signal transducer with metallopeptidase domain
MMAALMMYGLVIGTCVAVAAFALERIARQLRRPLRWIWVAALVTIALLMSAVPLRRATKRGAEHGPSAASATALPTLAMPSFANRRVPPAAERLLGAAWLVMSGAMLAMFGGVHLRSRRLRGRWPVAEIDGARVRVAPGEGPAAMGVFHPDIVVPRWLLDRPRAVQEIVVAHETQHVRAGDPVLLSAAWLAAVAMPWNAAVWWIMSRLRLAVELDCDARVLGAGTPASVYGNLLIDVAAEHAGLRVAAPALVHPHSQLQRRLTAMYARTHRFAALRGALALTIAALALFAACRAELPTSSEIEAMNAASAERAARQAGAVGDSVIFIVDDAVVAANMAKAIPASRVARIETARSEAGEYTAIRLWTIEGIADTLKAVAPASFSEGKLQQADRLTMKIRKSAEVDAAAFQGLVFVDGKRVDPSSIRAMDRSSIASVEVLKGALARQRYSEPEALHGVIMITTRR